MIIYFNVIKGILELNLGEKGNFDKTFKGTMEFINGKQGRKREIFKGCPSFP